MKIKVLKNILDIEKGIVHKVDDLVSMDNIQHLINSGHAEEVKDEESSEQVAAELEKPVDTMSGEDQEVKDEESDETAME